MQDNLEFLQWARKYWDQTYSGQEYNASARRKGAPAEPPATIAPLGPSVRSHVGVSGTTASACFNSTYPHFLCGADNTVISRLVVFTNLYNEQRPLPRPLAQAHEVVPPLVVGE